MNAPTPAPLPTLTTIGVLARTLRVPLHRIEHVLRTRRHIRPSALAGRRKPAGWGSTTPKASPSNERRANGRSSSATLRSPSRAASNRRFC